MPRSMPFLSLVILHFTLTPWGAGRRENSSRSSTSTAGSLTGGVGAEATSCRKKTAHQGQDLSGDGGLLSDALELPFIRKK